MRYIVVGPGAVGGTIGGMLAAAGRDVVLVARGRNLAVLRSDGLTVATPEREFTVRPPVISGPAELTLAPGDALILAVKSQDTGPVLAAWSCAPVTGGSAAGGSATGSSAAGSSAAGSVAADVVPVFCAQNGVDNERQAARLFAQVYGVGVQLPAELRGPGQVAATGSPAPGLLEIGRYPRGGGQPAERLVADLEAAGFIARVTDPVMPVKYAKLLRNLRNAIIAACGSMDSEEARTLAGLAVAEAERCYQAAGIAYQPLGSVNAVRELAVRELPVGGMDRGGGSTWQSLHRQAGTVEADYLNGEIVLLGRLHGVPAPVNELLRQTVTVLAASRQPPGTVDPADLLARARGLTG